MAYLIGRAVAPDSLFTSITGWGAVFVVAAVPLAFAAGILRARLFSISVLQALMVELNGATGLVEFRAALGRALAIPICGWSR